MTYAGEYTVVAGEVTENGRIKMTLRREEENGAACLTLSMPPGSIVRLGEVIEVTSFCYVASPAQ